MIPVKTVNNLIIFLGEREMPITRERSNFTKNNNTNEKGVINHVTRTNGATRITINGETSGGITSNNDPTRFYVSSRENKSR